MFVYALPVFIAINPTLCDNWSVIYGYNVGSKVFETATYNTSKLGYAVQDILIFGVQVQVLTVL